MGAAPNTPAGAVLYRDNRALQSNRCDRPMTYPLGLIRFGGYCERDIEQIGADRTTQSTHWAVRDLSRLLTERVSRGHGRRLGGGPVCL